MTEKLLTREDIDFALADQINDLFASHLNSGKSPNPTGQGIATLALCLVNVLAVAPNLRKFSDDEAHSIRLLLLEDIKAFMDDLMNSGWSVPEEHRRRAKEEEIIH
jgi:hypothetical protein